MSSSEASNNEDLDVRIRGAQHVLATDGADAAEASFIGLVRDFPGSFRAWMTAGLFFQHIGRGVDAVHAFDRAIAIRPGDATVFTRRAQMLLRHHWGPPPPPRNPDTAKPRVGFSELGGQGRFGNQLLQYGALRLYADRAGAEAEAPDWIGRDLFDLDDPMPTGPLTRLSEDAVDLLAGPARSGVDLFGYFCGSWKDVSHRRNDLRALFRPAQRSAGYLETAEQRVRAGGRTVVAIHLRRGDFGYGKFWVAPEEWYSVWLSKLWPTLDNPVLYVATDAPALVDRFADFEPLSANDLAAPPPGAEFLADFHVLRSADVIGVSNSTFSVSAAMLNPTIRLAVRPDPRLQALRPFDPWSEPVLLEA